MKNTLLLFFVSINFLHAQTPASPEWKVMNEPGYSISYPVDWLADQSGQMGTSFILFSPAVGEQDAFRENVNLIIQDLTGNKMTMDQFVELSQNQVKTFITNAEILENERIKKDG